MKPILLQTDIDIMQIINNDSRFNNKELIVFLNQYIEIYLKDKFNIIANHLKSEGICWISFDTVFTHFTTLLKHHFFYVNDPNISPSIIVDLRRCCSDENFYLILYLFNNHVTLVQADNNKESLFASSIVRFSCARLTGIETHPF